MATSKKQISLFGEEKSTSSPAGSPVSLTPTQENDLEKKMTDTSGRKCLEQFGRFDRVGSWARTFAALLIGAGGVVFEEVHTDLETEGYEVQAFILPACGVDAPHRRDRVWFVAHSDLNNDRRTPGQNAGESREERVQKRNEVREPTESSEVFGASSDPNGGLGDQSHKELQPRGNTSDKKIERSSTDPKSGRSGGVRNPQGTSGTPKGSKLFGSKRGIQSEKRSYAYSSSHKRFKRRSDQDRPKKTERHASKFNARSTGRTWEKFPTQPPICGGDDELPRELDGITFSKWRNESIKAYGNAIVPQVAYQIFKSINEYEKQ